MNKLVPFSKLVKDRKVPVLSQSSVVIDKRGIPVGFFFGRDTLISLMTVIDNEFDKKVNSVKDAYNNFAGKIIDMVEEKLPIKAEYVSDLKKSISNAKKQGWVSLEDLRQSINV